jgi:hypothetical protein
MKEGICSLSIIIIIISLIISEGGMKRNAAANKSVPEVSATPFH